MARDWKCKCGHTNSDSFSSCESCNVARPKPPIWIYAIIGSTILIIALIFGVYYMMKLPEQKYKTAIKKCQDAEVESCEEAKKIAKVYKISDEKRKKWEEEIGISTNDDRKEEIDIPTAEEIKQHLNQGLNIITIAKANIKNKEVFNESIDNAIKEFSIAIEKASNQQALQATAYEQRGAAYLVQKKFNKALDDLKKASELQPESPTIFYNLACLYSLTKAVDLGLDALDKALTNGFKNYEALKNDTDLTNLRKSHEFKKILEKHKIWLTL